MNRITLLLSGLAALLIVVLFWLLVWSPSQEQLTQLREDTESVQAQQAQLQARISALRQVREQAPEAEAQLAAGDAIVPRDSALPSALRQLQLAADESGATLVSVSPGRPAALEGAPADVGELTVNLELLGSYFQVVDFLRRVEDPSISPRGLLWTNVNLSTSEYPTLTATLSGRMFARLPAPPPVEVEEPTAGEGEPADDVDVEVEVETQDEETTG